VWSSGGVGVCVCPCWPPLALVPPPPLPLPLAAGQPSPSGRRALTYIIMHILIHTWSLLLGPWTNTAIFAIPVVPCRRTFTEWTYYNIYVYPTVFICLSSHKSISTHLLLYKKSTIILVHKTAICSWHWGPASRNGEAEHPLLAIIYRAYSFHLITYHTQSLALGVKPCQWLQ
jgi:hypothetical protein